MRPSVRNIILSAPPPIIPTSVRPSVLAWWDGAKRGSVWVNVPMKNEVYYTPSTWAEWTKTDGVVANASGAELTANGSTFIDLGIATTLKSNTPYGYLFNIVSTTISVMNNAYISFTGATGETIYFGTLTGNQKFVNITDNPITDNSIAIRVRDKEPSGNKIKIKDVRIFELPADSQIATDFANLTADELNAKYPFGNIETIFGAGNTPTKAEMDAILASEPAYWDGTRTVLANPASKYYWQDYSGNGRHMKLNNLAYTTASGWNPTFATLDDTDDFARRVLATPVADGASYTAVAAVKCAASKAPVYLHTGATVAGIIGLDANGYVYATVYDTAGNAYTATDNVSRANLPTDIIVSVDVTGLVAYLYISGALRATAALSNTVRGFSTVSIGINAASNAYVGGNVYRAALLNKAANGAEARQIYIGSQRRLAL